MDIGLKTAFLKNKVMISNSNIFLGLLTKSYLVDERAVLQLGIGISLDKPIVILAEEGIIIPKHLEKLAIGIEWFKDSNDIERATIALMNRVDFNKI